MENISHYIYNKKIQFMVYEYYIYVLTCFNFCTLLGTLALMSLRGMATGVKTVGVTQVNSPSTDMPDEKTPHGHANQCSRYWYGISAYDTSDIRAEMSHR